MTTCKFCGFDALRERVATKSVPFDEGTIEVKVHSSVCDHCNRPQVTPDQDKANKRAINEAKRHALGIPSRTDLRRMRARWKMTQAAAGKLLGVGPTAFSKYENGEVLPAAPTARLLNIISMNDGAMLSLVRRYGEGVKLSPPADINVTQIASFTVSVAIKFVTATATIPDLDHISFPPIGEPMLELAELPITTLTSGLLPLALPAPSFVPAFNPLLLSNRENA